MLQYFWGKNSWLQDDSLARDSLEVFQEDFSYRSIHVKMISRELQWVSTSYFQLYSPCIMSLTTTRKITASEMLQVNPLQFYWQLQSEISERSWYHLLYNLVTSLRENFTEFHLSSNKLLSAKFSWGWFTWYCKQSTCNTGIPKDMLPHAWLAQTQTMATWWP